MSLTITNNAERNARVLTLNLGLDDLVQLAPGNSVTLDGERAKSARVILAGPFKYFVEKYELLVLDETPPAAPAETEEVAPPPPPSPAAAPASAKKAKATE